MIATLDRRGRRRIRLAGLVLLACALVLTAAPAAHAAPATRSGHTAQLPFAWRYQNYETKSCLGFRGDTFQTIQWECDNSDAEFWEVIPRDDGNYYEIHNYARPDLCLDVPGGTFQRGTQLMIYPCHGGDNQLWKAEGSPVCDGAVFVNKRTQQLVGAAGGQRGNGVPVVQWPHASDPDQTWCPYFG
jgi:hypothetical protein